MSWKDLAKFDGFTPAKDCTTLHCGLFLLPPYTGDSLLVEEKRCLRCRRLYGRPHEPTEEEIEEENNGDFEESGESKKKLLCCGRCKLAHYCSKYCQKEDFPKHKRICKKKSEMLKSVEVQEIRLQNLQDNKGEFYSLWYVATGSFWDIVDARPYCKLLLQFARVIEEFAQDTQQKHVWESALDVYLELLRVNWNDNQGARDFVPWVLMKLNRDGDCFSFIKWWMVEENHLHVPNPPPEKGEWVYSSKEGGTPDVDTILQDIASPPDLEKMYMSHLLPYCLIFLRIFAIKADKNVQELKTNFGKTDIENFVGSENLEHIDKYIESILDIINKKNPTVIPALFEPNQYLGTELPELYRYGSPEEAIFIVTLCHRQFALVPYVLARLAKRLGKSLTN